MPVTRLGVEYDVAQHNGNPAPHRGFNPVSKKKQKNYCLGHCGPKNTQGHNACMRNCMRQRK